jgi:hypothetical protein
MGQGVLWSRGFFRLWIIYAVIVVIITVFNVRNEKLYIKTDIWYVENLSSLTPAEENLLLRKLAIQSAKIRTKYPEYKYSKKPELFKDAHKRFYSDYTRKEFYKEIGLKTWEILMPGKTSIFVTTHLFPKKQGALDREALDYVEDQIKIQKTKQWDQRIESLQIGLIFLISPLIAGLVIRWVLLGFRGKKIS